jgi:hypothetical protein
MDYKEMQAALEHAKPASFAAPAPVVKAVPALSSHDQGLLQGVAETLAPYLKKIEALEQRVAELESGAMKYCGVHQPSLAYRKGNVVTYDGSAWCATRSVSAERPGSSDAWQLMVKHGKDAPVATLRSDTTETSSQRVNGVHSNPRMR